MKVVNTGIYEFPIVAGNVCMIGRSSSLVDLLYRRNSQRLQDFSFFLGNLLTRKPEGEKLYRPDTAAAGLYNSALGSGNGNQEDLRIYSGLGAMVGNKFGGPPSWCNRCERSRHWS